MFESSIFIGFLSRLFKPLGHLWKNSLTYRALMAIAAWLSKVYNGSTVVNFIRRDGFIIRLWDKSFLANAVDKLLTFIPKLLQKLYDKAEKVFSGSIAFRVILFFARNVHILLAVFMALTMIVPHAYWDNRYSTIAVFGFLLLFLINVMADKSIKLWTRVFDVYFVIFLMCILIAQVFSAYPALSLRFLIFHLTDFILIFVLVNTIRTKEQLATATEIILVGAALTGLYGVYQSIVGVPVIPSQVDLTLNEGMPGRVYSAFDNSNNYAQVLVMLIPFFLATVLSAKGVQKKIIFMLAALPPIVALIASYSRSGWIGFAVAVLVMLFLIKRSLIPLMVLFGLVVMPFLPTTILRRLASITNLSDSSISFRFEIWETMWPVIKDFWEAGMGLGTDVVQKLTWRYPLFTKGSTLPVHCHNVYLQIWVEMGIVGLLSFLGIIWRTLKQSLRAVFSKDTDTYVKNFLKAGVAGLLGILAICLVEYVWFYPRVMLIFWLLVGLMLAAVGIAKRDAEAKEARE